MFLTLMTIAYATSLLPQSGAQALPSTAQDDAQDTLGAEAWVTLPATAEQG